MSQRGRPRHPDVLTPREWDVLTLVREGLTNVDIAERLGISRDAVKYHVSEILGKLELRSREEAAAWSPEPAREPGAMRPVWASAAGPIAALLRWLPWGRVALVGTAAAAVGVGGVLLAGELSGDSEEVISQPSATQATETAAPATAPPLVPDAGTLVLGEPISLPAGWSMVLETGCFQCDGQTTGLIRVWMDSGGVAHMDRLFGYTPPTAQSAYPYENDYTPPEVASNPTVSADGISVGASDDGSVIAVSYCPAGCGIGGMAAPGPNDPGIIYRSLDGGVTWDQIAERTPAVYIDLVLPNGRVVVSNIPVGLEPEEKRFELLPGGDVLSPVPTSSGVVPAVVMLPGGEIGWVWRGGVVTDTDGNVQFQLPEKNGPHSLAAFVPMGKGDAGERITALWIPADATGFRHYLSVIDGGEPLVDFETDRVYTAVSTAFSNLLVGNAAVTTEDVGLEVPLQTLPVFIDVAAGEIEPLTDPFLTDSYPPDRYHVRGVTGRVAYRVSGTGSCLNIRADASPDSQSLACVADGVLLLAPGEGFPDSADGPWRGVVFGDTFGWASADFLEE